MHTDKPEEGAPISPHEIPLPRTPDEQPSSPIQDKAQEQIPPPHAPDEGSSSLIQDKEQKQIPLLHTSDDHPSLPMQDKAQEQIPLSPAPDEGSSSLIQDKEQKQIPLPHTPDERPSSSIQAKAQEQIPLAPHAPDEYPSLLIHGKDQKQIPLKQVPLPRTPDEHTSSSVQDKAKEQIPLVPHTPDEHTRSPIQDRVQKHTLVTNIMVLGPSGSGKTLLINTVSGEKLPTSTDGMSLCTASFCTTSPFTIGERSFRLIDSPGLYMAALSTSDIMKKLIVYLVRNRNDASNLSGILYLHPEGKDTGDEELRRTMEALRHLVGEPWLPSVTIAVVGNETTADSIAQLREPTSPFYSLCHAGAKILPLSLELSSIQDILAGIEPSSSQPRFFGKTSWDRRWRHSVGVDEFVNEIMGPKIKGPSPKEHSGKTGRPQPRISLEESETSRQQLQATLDATEADMKALRSQLAQTQLEYASLRSELQLHDNTEQSKIVQSLQDLNRAIDDFGRSVAEYMVDNFAATLNKDDPTTVDASDFPELQRQFGHQAGRSSLVASLGNNGLPIEDFIDLALRNFLCQKLYSGVFTPFYPTACAEPDLMTSLYEEVRRQGPSVVAAKWRACSFMALSKGNKLDKPSIKGLVESLIKEDIQPLFDNLFSQSTAVTLTEAQRSQLQDVITVAWELNYVLKGEVVTLGDFLPLCCERGVPFDPKTMVEFEASKKRQPGNIAICTIRLGLTLSHAKGAGKDGSSSVVCPATVVTPTIYGLNN